MAFALPLLALWLVTNVALLALAAALDRRRLAQELEAGAAPSPGRVVPMRTRGLPG